MVHYHQQNNNSITAYQCPNISTNNYPANANATYTGYSLGDSAVFTCNVGYEPVPAHITNMTSYCELKDDDDIQFKKEAKFMEPAQNMSCVGQFPNNIIQQSCIIHLPCI